MAEHSRELKTYDPSALIKAVRVLADTCDGAQGKDFVGFNRADSRYGTMLALAPASSWTNSVCYEAWMMLAKYKNQLLINNINYDEIEPPLRPSNFAEEFSKANIKLNNQTKNSISTNGELFIIRCEYDEQLIEQIREIPNVFWNTQALVWLAPLSSEEQIAKLVQNYGFTISEGVSMPGITSVPITNNNKKITMSKSGRLIFDFEYHPEIVAEIKKIPGRLWDVKKKFWSIPPVISGIEIADKYGFEVSSQIRTAIMNSAKKEAELLEKSASVDADIEVQNLSGTLMPYQKAGVSYASSVGRCLIADQMGLGKTVEAIATLELRDAFPAVVVCPASLKENWRREINKWLPHRTVNIVSGKTDIVNADVNIVNYDILYKFVDAIKHLEPSGLVLDESHYVKNGASKRTKAAKDIASKVPKSGSV